MVVFGGIVFLLLMFSGCQEQTSVEYGNQNPIAYANADSIAGTVPFLVNFTGSGLDYDGHIMEYRWDFKDGTTSTDQNPQHLFDRVGTYTCTLTIIDDEKGTAADTVIVVVTEPNYDDESFIQWITDTNTHISENQYSIKNIPTERHQDIIEQSMSLNHTLSDTLEESSMYMLSEDKEELRTLFISYLTALQEWCSYLQIYHTLTQQEPLDEDKMEYSLELVDEYDAIAESYQFEILQYLH